MSVVDVITSSYHILYSPSYAVPVMYFNMFHSGNRIILSYIHTTTFFLNIRNPLQTRLYFFFPLDGRLLTIEEVWREVPVEFQDELRANSWRAITQTVGQIVFLFYGTRA